MERYISYDLRTNSLAWTLTGSSSNLGFLVSQKVEKGVNENAIVEVSPASIGIFKTIADNIAKNGGAALIIDYGYLDPIFKSSLQAIKNHKFVDPLSQPGNADISSHVDFALLKREAEFFDINFHGPIGQGIFLNEMGINERAKALEQGATSQQSKNIHGAVDRLINKGSMGELFKVIALTSQQIKQAPGFSN